MARPEVLQVVPPEKVVYRAVIHELGNGPQAIKAGSSLGL